MQSSPPLPVPLHVAIIMDGNGRWGIGQNMTRADGHRAGVEALGGKGGYGTRPPASRLPPP